MFRDSDFSKRFKKLKKFRILVVGDLLIDIDRFDPGAIAEKKGNPRSGKNQQMAMVAVSEPGIVINVENNLNQKRSE